MRILALDTSTEFLSLALIVEGQYYTRHIHAVQSHSQQILPLVDALLKEAEMTIDALDGIAFGAGPGSFTGLRIACGVTQGLAFGANIPVIGVCTLMAMAQQAYTQSGATKVLACLDARMSEVYHASYVLNISEAGHSWQQCTAPALYAPASMPILPEPDWVGVGNGWQVYAEQLQARQSVREVLVDIYPQATAIAALAMPMFKAGLGRPAAEAAPIYIRNKVALKTSER